MVRLRRIFKGAIAMNLLSMLLLSQQFPVVEAGQGRGPGAVSKEYEYMIKPNIIPGARTEADRLYGFATRLLDSGAFRQAAIEFQRFVHYFPDHRLNGEAAYAVAWALFKGGEYDEALVSFRKVYISYGEEELRARALYMMAESDYQSRDFTSAVEIYGMVTEQFGNTYRGHRAAFMVGWSYLRSGRWQEASESFSSLSVDNPYAASADTLSEQALHGFELDEKSPLAAGLLSAYLPGAGQFYAGRKRDALVAFLINQGFIIGGISSIYAGNIFLGVTLLSLEAGWYSGNIYSAVNGAHKNNRFVRQDFVGMLHLKYGLK